MSDNYQICQKASNGHCNNAATIIQTDTIDLNPEIFPKLRVARFTSSLRQPCDPNEIPLTQKRMLLPVHDVKKYC